MSVSECRVSPPAPAGRGTRSRRLVLSIIRASQRGYPARDTLTLKDKIQACPARNSIVTAEHPDSRLTPVQQDRLGALCSAETLTALKALFGATTEHDAYLRAKAEWRSLGGQERDPPDEGEGLPGRRVSVDGQGFHVHGVTHADTDAERTFLRDHVRRLLDAGAVVYCEQGIREMYFSDMSAVCETDDYRWAMHHCRERDIDSHIDGETLHRFETDHERVDLGSVVRRFREATFSLIESGTEVYGDRFAAALGDVASQFLLSHGQLATGEDFEAFQRTQAAAEDPAALPELQRYYERSFLPQPLEREWLRRHDPELELFTHARNERIAAHVLAHARDSGPVHLLTGAAHQPGVTHYLRACRDDEWAAEPFESVP